MRKRFLFIQPSSVWCKLNLFSSNTVITHSVIPVLINLTAMKHFAWNGGTAFILSTSNNRFFDFKSKSTTHSELPFL
jgi:hypothetical protein